MDEVEAHLGYAFHDRALLEAALTHPSYGGDHRVPHYQRLEFLGDAVCELRVSERLYAAFPQLPEGNLTRMRADLVCEASLSKAARRLGLAERIRLSVGEERTGGRKKPSILCDVMEAVVGAVYLDGGRDAANALIERAIGADIDSARPAEDHLYAKSRLQGILQSGGRMPVYELIERSGPDHMPLFRFRVSADGEALGEGAGHSKQQAQIAAAEAALARLRAGA